MSKVSFKVNKIKLIIFKMIMLMLRFHNKRRFHIYTLSGMDIGFNTSWGSWIVMMPHIKFVFSKGCYNFRFCVLFFISINLIYSTTFLCFIIILFLSLTYSMVIWMHVCVLA